jgi:hypothetical protein
LADIRLLAGMQQQEKDAPAGIEPALAVYEAST